MTAYLGPSANACMHRSIGCTYIHTGTSALFNAGMLFGWELILAFILVSTVYACAIGAPNFGNIAPLAVGVSLALDLMAGAAYSGGGVSPVRVLGPAIVFHCNWNTAWVYMLGGMGLMYKLTY